MVVSHCSALGADDELAQKASLEGVVFVLIFLESPEWM